MGQGHLHWRRSRGSFGVVFVSIHTGRVWEERKEGAMGKEGGRDRGGKRRARFRCTL